MIALWVFNNERGKLSERIFQLIWVGQNSKEKFSRSIWNSLTLKIARIWFALSSFPQSTGRDFDFHFCVRVECMLLENTY